MFWISAAVVLVSLPTEQLRAALPSKAQESFDKGVIAARQREWEVAIQNFLEARKTAPDAPELFYNLGLAESKIPGRELRAISWFGAYLAVNANAPNAADVKEEINILSVKSQSNISHLIKLYQDAHGPTDREYIWHHVARLWIKAGDAARAEEAADLISKPAEDLAWNVVSVQAASGDFAGAQRRADRIHEPGFKNRAEFEIARAQAEAGDLVGARKTIALITDLAGGFRNYRGVESRARAEKEIAEIGTNQFHLPVSVSNWVENNELSLNHPIHTNIGVYLKSLPSDDPRKLLTALQKTAEEVIRSHNYVQSMVKEQATLQAKQ